MRELPFSNESFDVAISIWTVIAYMLSEDDLNKFFGKIYRVLNKNGLFVIDTCNPFLEKNGGIERISENKDVKIITKRRKYIKK